MIKVKKERKMAAVVKVEKAEEFDKLLTDAGSHLVVVHFSAAWAPQCQQMNDVMTELSKDNQLSSVKFLEINAEGLAEISKKYRVVAVPTCVFFKNKKQIDRFDGAKVAELSKKVKELATEGNGPASSPAPASKEDLNARLKKLISAAPVMAFIKGTPEEPRCGFSRTLIKLLNENNIKYSTFNILADEDVRQGLKTFSNWPTFPQVYANGELVGGLDIIKELVETGQLESELGAGGEAKLEERRHTGNQESVLTTPDGKLFLMPDLDIDESADSGDEKDTPLESQSQINNQSSLTTKSDSTDADSQQESSEAECNQKQREPVNSSQYKIAEPNNTVTDKNKIPSMRQNFRKRKKLEDCVTQLKEDCISSAHVLEDCDNVQNSTASVEQSVKAQIEGTDYYNPYGFIQVKKEPKDHSELQFCYDQDVVGQAFTDDLHSNLMSQFSGNPTMSGRNKRKRKLNNVWKVNIKGDSRTNYDDLCQFRKNQKKRKQRLKRIERETSDPEMRIVLEERRKMFEQSCKSTEEKCSSLHNKMCVPSEDNAPMCSEKYVKESLGEAETLVEIKQELDEYLTGDELSDFCLRSSDDSDLEPDNIEDEWLPNSTHAFRKNQKSPKLSNSAHQRRLSDEIRKQKNTEYRRKRREELRLSNPEKLQEEREKDRTRKQMLRKRNQLLLSLPPDLLSEAAGLAGNSGILDDDGNPISVPFPFSPGDDIEELKEKEEQRRATNRDRMRTKRMHMDGMTKERIKIVSREKMRQRRAQIRDNDPIAAAVERERQKLKKREERKRNAILLSLPDETLKEAANNMEILQAAIASLTDGTPSDSPLSQLPLDSETAANLAKLRSHLEMKRAEAAERVRKKRAELREKDPEQAAAIREREKIRKRIERRRNTLLLSLPPDELVKVTVASINEGEDVPFPLPSLLALSTGQLNTSNMSSDLPAVSADSSDPAIPQLTEELVKMREKLERKRALDRERMRQRRAKLKENPEAAAAFKEKERLRKQMERWKKSMGLFDTAKPLETSPLDPSLFVSGPVANNPSGKEIADSPIVNKSLLSMFSLGTPDFSTHSSDHLGKFVKGSIGQSADSHNSVLSNSVSSLNVSGSSMDSSFNLSTLVNQSKENVNESSCDDVQTFNGNSTETVLPLHSNDIHSAIKTELSPEEMEKFPKGFDSNEEQDIQMDVANNKDIQMDVANNKDIQMDVANNKDHEIHGASFPQSVAHLISPSVMRVVPSLFEDSAPNESVTNVLSSSSQSTSASQMDNDTSVSENFTMLHNERQSSQRKVDVSDTVTATSSQSGTSKSPLQESIHVKEECKSPLQSDIHETVSNKSMQQDDITSEEVSSISLPNPSILKRATEWFIYQLSILQSKMGDRFLQLDPNPKQLEPLSGGIAAQLSTMQLLLVQQLIGPMPVLPGQPAASQVLDPHAFEVKLTEMMIKGYEYREQNRTRARNYRDRLKHDPDYKEKYEQKKLRDLERKRIHRARESELRRLYPEYDEARRQQQRQRRSRLKMKKKNKTVDSDDSQSDEMLQFELSQTMMGGSSDPLEQDLNKVTSDILSVYSKLDGDRNESNTTTDKTGSGYNLRDVSSAKKLRFVYDENYDDSMDSEPNKPLNLSKSEEMDRGLPYRDFENTSDSDDDDSLSDDDESSMLMEASQ